MDEQLNDLKKRINEVFDQLEAPAGAADAGWTELRKKYPAEKKRRIAAWWWSSAAILLVLILAGVWFYKASLPHSSVAMKTKPTGSKRNLQNQPDTPSFHSSAPVGQQLTSIVGYKTNYHQIFGSAHFKSLPSKKDIVVLASQSPLKETDSSTTITVREAAPLASLKTPALPNSSLSKPDSSMNLAVLPANQLAAAAQQTDSVKKQKRAASMEEIFAHEAGTSKYSEKIKEKKTQKKVIFSVYAGTYLNYAKGSSNQINAGAGVTSDIRLVGRLKLVTGVAIGQNSLSYNGEPTQPMVYAAALNAIGKPNYTANANYTSAPALFNSVAITKVTNYTASFTGLDVPVNIKYDLSSGNSNTYILAGVSSGTYINESYNYNYTNTLVTTTSQTAGTQSRFGTFDFAHTLNVAFGIATPFGKSNRLTIEPFLKYPLSGLGTQQIRFGAGGINLKFNLLSHKP